MVWDVPKIWKGGQCIIIGGGPSLIKQFDIPEDIVAGVYTKTLTPEAYSPYLEQLHTQHVIGVNVAYKIGNWIDVMFFGDESTWKEEKEELIKFKGLRVTCADTLNDDRRLKYLRRDPRKRTGITTNTTMLSWNNNSGSAAINLAVHFGVKRIILLGFDMQLDPIKNQHWHKFYSSNLMTIDSSMKRHLRSFPDIAKDLKSLGIEVINANPQSKIDVFPKMNFKDIKL